MRSGCKSARQVLSPLSEKFGNALGSRYGGPLRLVYANACGISLSDQPFSQRDQGQLWFASFSEVLAFGPWHPSPRVGGLPPLALRHGFRDSLGSKIADESASDQILSTWDPLRSPSSAGGSAGMWYSAVTPASRSQSSGRRARLASSAVGPSLWPTGRALATGSRDDQFGFRCSSVHPAICRSQTGSRVGSPKAKPKNFRWRYFNRQATSDHCRAIFRTRVLIGLCALCRAILP